MTASIPARYFGPAFSAGNPRQIVVHSVESEIKVCASSLASGWFRTVGNQTSAHAICDPLEVIEMVPDTQRAWHCGNGNSTSLGIEHAGRAAFTRAQWTTPDGLAMLRLSAAYAAGKAGKFGIPLRWLTPEQVRDNEKGFCTHNDMRLGRGGTTHTDPGPGFPYDLYLQYAAGVKPAPAPKPVPAPTWEDDMAISAEGLAQIRAIVKDEMRGIADAPSGIGGSIGDQIRVLRARADDRAKDAADTRAALAGLPKAVWDQPSLVGGIGGSMRDVLRTVGQTLPGADPK